MDGSESDRIAAPAPQARARPSRRGLAIAGAAWVAVTGGALGVASLLNSEPRDAPPPLQSVAPQGLPLLFVYLDRALPAEVANLPTLADQVTRLEELATTENDPARWVELGTIAQRAGNLDAAEAAFQQALTIDRDRLDATVGLAMNLGATGPEGLAEAEQVLAELERRTPGSQLVVFNRGIVAVYRRDRPQIERSFARAIALGPNTPLGSLARRFRSATP